MKAPKPLPMKQSNVDETVAQLRSEGLEVRGCACHVGDEAQRRQLVTNTLEAYGPSIDVLVSNAAVNPTAGPLLSTPLEAMDKILDINVKAALALLQAVAPHMPSGGSVVMVSSVTAYNPPFPIGFYAVSKTALLGLVKGLAAEMGAAGVRVNGVAPGIVPTKFSQALVADPALEQAQIEATSLKRLGTPEDIAGAVAFLASSDGAYVTGETLVVAGGMPSKL
ncbi:dehydrogenase/reductase SDR familymember 4 [Monoraphidium neglectum]|uniref:Dehydrogenase/reductase SDR familymember 4 n=1 Tax=Monoraphidium neglectum TaxID=145388 RepID=A0A0D2MFA9_9CHLO|nr:dehydrogenase/reductase SDR familymember 4 [Monoraphidium neglectum]KIY99416.1 dehydrogenase/reductase SDR familymember 4 [Monoraphidium neglectum]|eukprot:XP_013898436.1 dehydrogenase/reductase SDR familymember 4 [Monoraphidium neglectum]